MGTLAFVFYYVVQIMKIPFFIWGYSLSLWDIFLYTVIAPIVIYLIVGFFND